MKKQKIYRLVFAALFTAVTCVFTMVIRIPSPGPGGYVNIGDTAVLLTAWIIGGWYGALAAGLGSAMADLLCGYAIYLPGTFAIKFLMAVTAWGLCRILTKTNLPSTAARLVSGLAAEVLMVLGYLVFEACILGFGAAALPDVLSNSIQAIANLVLAAAAAAALESARALMPLLQQ